jgi:ubiquinone/menaquinone biosynthesis C-methylase UbiE
VSESPWERADTVRGFVESPPNQTLLGFAAGERTRCGVQARALDIGCGAGRNAVPLAQSGWRVAGIDSSQPMLAAARQRCRDSGLGCDLVQAEMAALPFADDAFDLVIAHGVWNLASGDEIFRRALRAAARVSRPGAGLFVFTFSRQTLPSDAVPLDGEIYAYEQFSGRPQIFLTAEQLVAELATAGFEPDPGVPLREHNRPRGMLASTGPVIYEGAFRRRNA